MAAYHILQGVVDPDGKRYYVTVPRNTVFVSLEEATEAVKGIVTSNPRETYYLVQEVGRVAVEPVVTMTLEPPQPKVVYRDAGLKSQAALELEAEEPESPKREPQVKPRLLIVDRKATPAELVGHLMVVAEGRIVKNAFGALEIGDMPLAGWETQAVQKALGAAQ
jgi:hypothetical protein